MTNITDVSDMKMTSFIQGVDLIDLVCIKWHVRINHEAKLQAKELTGINYYHCWKETNLWDETIFCCFVRNSVLYGLRSSLSGYPLIFIRKVAISKPLTISGSVTTHDRYLWDKFNGYRSLAIACQHPRLRGSATYVCYALSFGWKWG